MAKLAQPANVEGNKDQIGDFSPVPSGKYPGQIMKSEYKQTKAKTGHYLECQAVILDGEFRGRMLFERLNLDNPNPVAVEIANKTLNTICHACGKIGVQDSEELHGIPMLLTVIKKEATETQPAGNDIKFYEPMVGTLGGSPATIPPAAAPATAPAAPAAVPAGRLPWEKDPAGDDDIPF